MNTLELSATTKVTRTEANQLTSNIIETGSVASDHVINKGSMITFEGVITDLSAFGIDRNSPVTRTTDEYLSELQRIRDNKEFFDITLGDISSSRAGRVNGSLFNRVTNCLFESFTVTQDSSHGVVYGSVQNARSYHVTFTAHEIRVAQAARLVDVKVPDSSIEVTTEPQSIIEAAVAPLSIALDAIAGKQINNAFGLTRE